MIGIIGFGKMGRALAEGMTRKGFSVMAIDKGKINAEGVKEASDYGELPECEAILLCVKPKDMQEAIKKLKEAILKSNSHPLLISIAAGKTISWLEKEIGDERIVRAMPNLAAKVGKSATCFAANNKTSGSDLELVENIFGCVGECRQVKEGAIDIATAIGASGLAYFFYFTKALAEAGVEAGLDEETAAWLACKAFGGAASIVEEGSSSLDGLIEAVATPGGTTEAGLKVFEKRGLGQSVREAVKEAKARAVELGT